MANAFKTVNDLQEAMQIEACIQDQDERDRINTNLYGVNEEAGTVKETMSKSAIKVNNNCINCSGNASFIKKAFKIACIGYGSSMVSFKNQSYTRAQLLKMQMELVSRNDALSIQFINLPLAPEQQFATQTLEDTSPMFMATRNST